MKKKILLIEPGYPTKVLPFGLQKIASFHLDRGDSVQFVKGNPKPLGIFSKYYPDMIYITSLFTYRSKEVIQAIKLSQKYYPGSDIRVGGVFASLMPEYIESETRIVSHKGLLKEVDDFAPDFSCFPFTEKATIITTRGCVRKCKFCAVSVLEPERKILKNWRKQIGACGDRYILVQDNNFITSSWDHQKDVVDYLIRKGNEIDFNGGFDCRLFKKKHAKLYSRLNMNVVRFAFDDLRSDGYIQRVIEFTSRYMSRGYIRMYVLYNFKDTPGDFYYRLKEVSKIGDKLKLSGSNLRVESYPMMYTPLYSLGGERIHSMAYGRNYIGVSWTKELIVGFLSLLQVSSHGNMVVTDSGGVKKFEEMFGRNEKEFVDILSSYKKRKRTKKQMKRIKDMYGSLFTE